MALTFPLTLAQWSDVLRVQTMVLHAPPINAESITAAGEVLGARLGNTLWQGKITLAPAYHADAREARVMLDVLQRPGASALLSPPDYDGPTGSYTLQSV